jgi:hypothetical protein
MAAQKKIYVHFERPSYIGGKSELLKVQMEILYLKKIIKNLSLTREKKIHYQQMLGEVFLNIKKSIEKLDSLMPEESEIPQTRIGKGKPVKKETLKKKVISSVSKPDLPIKSGDDIESELLRIKQKLEALNRG